MKNKYKNLVTMFIAVFVLMLSCMGVEAKASDDMVYGVDIGWLNQLENAGVTWVDDDGITKDALQLLKDKGVNAIRIRPL